MPPAGAPAVRLVGCKAWTFLPCPAVQAERGLHRLPGAQDHGPPVRREGARARTKRAFCMLRHATPPPPPGCPVPAPLPGLGRDPPLLQMYQMLASMGWLELQNTVKKELGEDNPYTALVPDLSGAPPPLLPLTHAPPPRPAAHPPARPTEVPVPGQPGLAEAEEHGAQAVQPGSPLHRFGARPLRSKGELLAAYPLRCPTLLPPHPTMLSVAFS